MSKTTYDPATIEPKWQKHWEELELFQGSESQGLRIEDHRLESQKKSYLLFAFAYPSGSGLHVGHVESKTALDIVARYKRMHGERVFFPVGWDAFGLPAENYAVKTGVHPAETTKNAINTFRKQIKRIGISYDWKNEIATSHPEYYKWTQWIFLQLHKKGLAYQKLGMVNWCPSCQTVLANEQVVSGECERCGSEVIQKEMKQWFFKITEYKDELISGLDLVDWPEATKQQQLNWIGKSEGAEVRFKVQGSNVQDITCFTTRVDTIFGVTYLVISPEKFTEMNLMELVGTHSKSSVQAYIDQAQKKTEEERKIGEKEKTGVDTGLKAVNPVNGEGIPIFVADYVLGGYGTGAVMGVPAHDTRDHAFAQKFELPIIQVIDNGESNGDGFSGAEYGTLINSGEFNGLTSEEAMSKITTQFPQHIKKTTTYKLRDWLISRQRYWGAPIPIVYDPEGNAHPVKEEHLPWELPTDVEFKPTGESPLTHSKEFIDRTERLYGKGWRPEFDTMDTFVDSSWYFLRYIDSRNSEQFASKEQLMKWLPVDFYMIGPEHIVLHLLYSRFFTKFLRDEGYLSDSRLQIADSSKKEEELRIEDQGSRREDGERRTEDYRLKSSTWRVDEPFLKMRHQGMILGPDGRKMSKSKGNVINPDEIIEKFGADTLRVYEMFMGPIEADKPWNTNSVVGIYRFLNRIFTLVNRFPSNSAGRQIPDESGSSAGSEDEGGDSQKTKDYRLKSSLRRKLHQTIKKVTEDIPELKFNTAIASMMELVNEWETEIKNRVLRQAQDYKGIEKQEILNVDDVKAFIKILCPFAPFLAEELWHIIDARFQMTDSSDSIINKPEPRAQYLKPTTQSVHLQFWPAYDPDLLIEDEVTIVVQVNGKVRGQITISVNQASEKDQIIDQALAEPSVQKWIESKELVKKIYIPKKLVSLVVR